MTDSSNGNEKYRKTDSESATSRPSQRRLIEEPKKPFTTESNTTGTGAEPEDPRKKYYQEIEAYFTDKLVNLETKSSALEEKVKKIGKKIKELNKKQKEFAIESRDQSETLKKELKTVLENAKENFANKITESQIKAIETIGIFAGLFTLVSISFGFFKENNNPLIVAGLILILGAILAIFLLLLHMLVSNKKINSLFTKFLNWSICFLMVGIALILCANYTQVKSINDPCNPNREKINQKKDINPEEASESIKK